MFYCGTETWRKYRKKSMAVFWISLIVFVCFLALSLAAIPFALSNALPHILDKDVTNGTCTICDYAMSVAHFIKSLFKKLILMPTLIVFGAMLCLTKHFSTSPNDHTLIYFKTRLNN